MAAPLVANRIEALLAIGEWDEADSVSAAALRGITANYPHMPLIIRAELEIGRGDFDAARAHLEAARATLRRTATWRSTTSSSPSSPCGSAAGRTPTRRCATVWRGRAPARPPRSASGSAPRDCAHRRSWQRSHAPAGTPTPSATGSVAHEKLLADARSAAAEASAVTPNAAGWLALAEAEAERARGEARPEAWSEAAATWERLERPPLAAYCRWRQAEALVAAGAPRTEASVPLREAHAVAARIGARPLARELELLAQRARLDLIPPDAEATDGKQGLEEILGLTPREAEVLTLVARGYTNREIAATLVISVKTAGVHVSHILRKLDAPNRLEAAAIAHRLAPPQDGRPGTET